MAIDAIIKRYLGGLLVIPVAMAAYFQAVGVVNLVGASLQVSAKERLDQGDGARLPQVLAPPEKVYHSTNANQIISRNVFDSEAGDLNPKLETGGSDDGGDASLPPTSRPYEADKCKGSRVLATAVWTDAASSFATLKKGGSDKTEIRRQGEEFDGKKVWFVSFDRVWLISPSEFCQLKLYDPDEGAAKAPKRTAKRPPPRRARGRRGRRRRGPLPVEPGIRKRIRRISATEVEVDRSAVDEIIEKQSRYMKGIRGMPVVKNGKTIGFRFSRITPDSLMGVLGVKNGDLVKSINGFDISNPEKALQAYAKLRTASRLTVAVNRGGKMVNLDVNIK